MKKSSKLIIIIIGIFILSGCSLPFQSENYPGWTTKGVLEGYTLSNGKTVGGWLGAQVNEPINTSTYSFTVKKIEELKEYQNYKAQDNTILIHAQIEIANTTDKDITIFDSDFALVWDLEKEEKSNAYSLKSFNNELVIEQRNTKSIDIVYEINKDIKKPYAIYYYEQYNGQKGNEYYVYYK